MHFYFIRASIDVVNTFMDIYVSHSRELTDCNLSIFPRFYTKVTKCRNVQRHYHATFLRSVLSYFVSSSRCERFSAEFGFILHLDAKNSISREAEA